MDVQKKKKTKQKNTLRAITDNANVDSKRERDKKLGPNLNYFFNETTSEQVVVIIICYKKTKTKTKKRKSVIMLQKKIRNQSNLTWGI